MRIAAVGIHDPDVAASLRVGLPEHDLASVGRERRREQPPVGEREVRELRQAAPVGAHRVELRALVVDLLVRAEEDARAVRRPVGVVAGVQAPRRDPVKAAAVDIHDEQRAPEARAAERRVGTLEHDEAPVRRHLREVHVAPVGPEPENLALAGAVDADDGHRGVLDLVVLEPRELPDATRGADVRHVPTVGRERHGPRVFAAARHPIFRGPAGAARRHALEAAAVGVDDRYVVGAVVRDAGEDQPPAVG